MKRHSYLHKSETNTPKILGLIILILFVFTLGWHVGVSQNSQNSAQYLIENHTRTSGKDKVDMELFWDVWSILASKYVEPQALDFKDMIYGAIRGMVFSLEDPYTTFLTPKENKDFHDNLDGTLEGIGAELTIRNELITVVSPLKNSPAKKAGLLPEDIILKVDGEDVGDYTFEQVIMLIRGPKGTEVILTIGRIGNPEPFEIFIIREAIDVPSVEWKMEGDIAVIELNQFGTNTKEEFTKAVNDLLTKRPKGIILDMRFNGGGFLDGAVYIVSEFIDKGKYQGKVVSIKKRNPLEDEVIYVSGKAKMASLPLVVLINKGSASASEIVAGAIQDYERGIVIGETSFGKGTVQEVENLVDGSSLRVTVAKWYTPENRNISENGITPDIKIELTPEDYDKKIDPQMDEALKYLREL